MTTLIASAALVRDTFREAFARKLFWGLFGLSTALILFFLFIMKIDVVQGALATVSLFGQTTGRSLDVSHLVRQVHAAISSFLYTWLMFLALFASAGLISSVFEPGRIELLLSKPVSRHHILLGRFVGNLLVVGSIANIIVINAAQRRGIAIGWREHARVGVPVTLATLVIAAGCLWLRLAGA